MNNYGKLIRSHIIALDDILFENYKCLGLDEVDMTMLVFLNHQKEAHNDFLSPTLLSEKMTLNENQISERLLNLLQNGYLELRIDDNTTKEKFFLDPLIDKLANLLEKVDNEETPFSNEESVKSIVEYCEKTYARVLTTDELKIINMWVDDQYSYDEITMAVLDSLKAKKTQLRYADAILVNRKTNEQRQSAPINEEIKEALSGINVKRNYR